MSTLSGLAHCVHHNIHFEFCYDLAQRQGVIRDTKPKEELKVRLANLWLFPLDQLPADLQKADADWQKADADWQKAAADLQKAAADLQKADDDLQKADADWQKADADLQKADDDLQKADAAHLPDIQALHDKLVVSGYVCTWNGVDIFEEAPHA